MRNQIPILRKPSRLLLFLVWGLLQTVSAGVASPLLRDAVHPRLYWTAQRLEQFHSDANASALLQHLRDKVIYQADAYVRQDAPEYHLDPHDKEQLWQRNVGDALPFMATAYLLTKDRKYLQGAMRWAGTAASYPLWGQEGKDLAAAHLLEGMALLYDWGYNDLNTTDRKLLEETMLQRGSILFEAIARHQKTWTQAYLQNHLWINSTALATVGLALDRRSEVQPWIQAALESIRKTQSLLGTDGASHEGYGYWSYGCDFLLRFMDLSREFLDADFFETRWWKETSRYEVYGVLPRHVWGKPQPGRKPVMMDYADSDRFTWHGPNYILRKLAHEYRDGYAQGLADALDEGQVSDRAAIWLNLIWYDRGISPQTSDSLPTQKWFEDMGLGSDRQNWSGNESMIFFKSGPPMGHFVSARHSDFSNSAAHVHPDANSFSLFGAGRFLIRNPGYLSLKQTAYENTLRVDHAGQMGEGGAWFNSKAAVNSQATLKLAQASEDVDYWVGECAGTYPAVLGVRLFERHLLYVKSHNVLVVIDTIDLAQPKPITLDFHPEVPAVQETNGAGWDADDSVAQLRIYPFDSGAVATATVLQPISHGGKMDLLPTLSLEHPPATHWQNVVAFSWAPGSAGHAAAVPVTLQHQVGTNQWKFSIGHNAILVVDTHALTAHINGR